MNKRTETQGLCVGCKQVEMVVVEQTNADNFLVEGSTNQLRDVRDLCKRLGIPDLSLNLVAAFLNESLRETGMLYTISDHGEYLSYKFVESGAIRAMVCDAIAIMSATPKP